MDFGDHIYIILAILFSVLGAFRKRKKKPVVSPTKKVSPARDIFEELFDMKQEVEDPIPQFDSQKPFVLQDVEPEYVVPEPVNEPQQRTFAEEVAYHQKAEAETLVSHDLGAVKSVPHKRHFILDDLHKRSEVQKAIIYSEILKPKF